MPTYVILVDWTDEGIRNVRSTVDRADRVTQLGEQKYGATSTQLYWTVGPHDLVAVADFPDEEAATAYALEASSGGPSGRRRCAPSTARRWRRSSRGWDPHRAPEHSLGIHRPVLT